jgi:hypothetical protein
MNSLTRKYIDDFLPYIKPERRDAFEKRKLKKARERGDIVRIEDTCSADGKNVLRRTYYFKNGWYSVLCATHVGVESLPA